MTTNAKADDMLNCVYLDCRSALQRYLAFSTRCPETTADLVQEIQDALNALPSFCKEFLHLSRKEGLTHQAIAERLGITTSYCHICQRRAARIQK